jgi:hypothetical protein
VRIRRTSPRASSFRSASFRALLNVAIKSELAPSGQSETAHFCIFQAAVELELWRSDPKARATIDEGLAAKGYDASYVLAQAYMRGAAQIEAIDKRIAFHEQRRSAALKDAGIWSDACCGDWNSRSLKSSRASLPKPRNKTNAVG